MDIIIRNPDPVPHEHSGGVAVAEATNAIIDNNDDRELAGIVVADLTQKINLIKREFDGTEDNPGPVALAHRAWKSGVALRDRAIKGFEDAKTIWLSKVKKFEYDVEQKRLAEAKKADAEARKKAELERQRQIQEAKKLGDREAVENLKEAPIIPQAVAPKTPEVTKAAGLRRSSPIWKWELTNYQKVPCKYHALDESAVDALVKKLGPNAAIPGISVYDARSRGME